MDRAVVGQLKNTTRMSRLWPRVADDRVGADDRIKRRLRCRTLETRTESAGRVIRGSRNTPVATQSLRRRRRQRISLLSAALRSDPAHTFRAE